MSLPAFKHFDWRKPGDPPGGILVRDEPLPKPVKHASVTLDIERELIRRYHENGDESALDRLVGAHRPMVVRIAQHLPRSDIPLKALVEYGMLGLRLAAQPPHPSKTKKGKMVGFDPSKGHRFSTYARSYARKEMMAALSGDLSEALKPEFQYKTTASIETWGEPEPEVNEDADWPRDLNIPHPDHSVRWSHYSARLLTRPWRTGKRADPDYWRGPKFGIWQSDIFHLPYPWGKFSRLGLSAPLSLSASSQRCSYHSAGGSLLAFITEWLGYARFGIAYLQRRRWQYCCKVVSALWNPPDWARDQYERKVKPRNYRAHPITPSELAKKDAFYRVWAYALKAFEGIANQGMEGWEDGGPDWDIENDFMLASLDRSHTLTGKDFRLPKKVLLERWRRGCERLGNKIKYKFNKGLGLFDKKGHLLPDFDALLDDLEGKVKVIRPTKSTSFLCIKPVASIYYMRGTDACEVISWRRYRPRRSVPILSTFGGHKWESIVF